jgi:hypothetical protein
MNFNNRVEQMRLVIHLFTLLLVFQSSFSFAGNQNLGYGKRDLLRMNLPVVGYKWPYRPGSLWVNLQSHHSFINYPTFGTRTGLPPLQLSVDHSFDTHFAFGAYVGYYNATYTDNFGDSKYQSTFSGNNIGLRLTFHFSDIFNNMFHEVVNVKKWDFYSTAFAGWHTIKWNVDSKYINTQDFSDGSFGSLGLVLGVKWMPTSRTGIFLEAGKSPVGWFSAGISGKLVK